ncbi:unnamed protein product [Paramecium octaurelia]|uniref:Nuclear factor related to kappa-B-binding protein second winged helix domain-containing protein n=1 Tax=Paramecium octaurelia TaxID=43137 RepID=A0A8S1V6E3_PAROT|nr:unnamed protein product [Paramecium octaurelia]
MNSRVDHYQKTYQINKKNLEQFVEQQMLYDNFKQFSSDEGEDEEQIFQGDKIILYYKGQQYNFPLSIMALASLENIFSVDNFTKQEIDSLCCLLPEADLQLFQDVIEGTKNFHFGSPLNIFLTKMKSGYFTRNKEICDKLEQKISRNHLNEYYSNLYDSFHKDQNRIQNVLQRKKRIIFQRSPQSISDDDEISKQMKLDDNNEEFEEEGFSTQTSQSQSSANVQQYSLQPQPQIQQQFIPSAQSLFIITPITPLPPLTSTSIATTAMTLALMQAKKSIKQQNKNQTQNVQESNIPNGQTNREWLEFYWKQERERYQNPLQPYTFTCIDGSKVTVAPVAKKLISGSSQKPRQHELLKNERPTYVTILSLVRDASARLPKGFGTRADIVNLVRDSQYINENLPEEKMSSIISGALDRLHQSTDPCVKYDQEKKIWIYLHHDRDSSYPEWQVATPAKNNSNKKKGQLKDDQEI